MITPDYAQLMARYNQWQNQSLYTAAASLGDEDLNAERGAFFGSIPKTLSHILWADDIWWSRFLGNPRPGISMQNALTRFDDLEALQYERDQMDQAILRWASDLTPDRLSQDLEWYSGAAQANMSLPLWICVTHAFNHQTHHRGQVHAMLTSAGARPEDTDIFMMPDLAG
jgi:uncharacterized damage-inducible protein DinB